MTAIGLYDTLFGQALWKFLLDLSNKGAVASNSHYIKFISHTKESIKCPTARRISGKPCKFFIDIGVILIINIIELVLIVNCTYVR